MNTAKMKDEVLFEHLFGDIHKGHVRTHGVAVLVGSPVLRWFGGHTGTVPHERVVDVDVDRCAVALRLPVAGDGDGVPATDIVTLFIERRRPLVGVAAPVETPLPVERYDFLALLFLGGQLQSGVIGQFVDAKHRRVFPVLHLCFFSHHLNVAIAHPVAFVQAVGLEAENPRFDRSEIDGLPDGVVHDVRELTRGEFRPVVPVR